MELLTILRLEPRIYTKPHEKDFCLFMFVHIISWLYYTWDTHRLNYFLIQVSSENIAHLPSGPCLSHRARNLLSLNFVIVSRTLNSPDLLPAEPGKYKLIAIPSAARDFKKRPSDEKANRSIVLPSCRQKSFEISFPSLVTTPPSHEPSSAGFTSQLNPPFGPSFMVTVHMPLK